MTLTSSIGLFSDRDGLFIIAQDTAGVCQERRDSGVPGKSMVYRHMGVGKPVPVSPKNLCISGACFTTDPKAILMVDHPSEFKTQSRYDDLHRVNEGKKPVLLIHNVHAYTTGY